MTQQIDKKAVGQHIKRIRLEMGYTLKEFGSLFKPAAADSLVSRWERGVSLPNSQRLSDIAFHSQMSGDELLHGKFCVWTEVYDDHEITEIAGCEVERQPSIDLLESYFFKRCPYCGKELQIVKADYRRQFTAELNIDDCYQTVDIDAWDEHHAWSEAYDELESDDDEVLEIIEHKPKRLIKGRVIKDGWR